jgi:uncharacterized protein
MTAPAPSASRHMSALPFIGVVFSRSSRLAAMPTRSVLQRLALLLVGCISIAIGAALTLWTGLGGGPLDVFNLAMSAAFGIPLTLMVWGVASVLIGTAAALGHRPGPGTIAAPLLIGPLLSTFASLLGSIDRPSSLAVVLAAHALGVVIIGFGAGALIVSGLGTGSGELLATAAAERAGRSEMVVRTVIEASWLAVGLLLGGRAGIGTVLVMVGVGPSVRLGHGRVAAVVAFVQVRRSLRRERDGLLLDVSAA